MVVESRRRSHPATRFGLESEEANMPSCPECETALNIDVEEVEEGDVIACDECGTEYEVVGVDPLELARVEEGIEEEDDLIVDDEEE
jgi:alpha-aminoadipate/glutamate carrier protein LysW